MKRTITEEIEEFKRLIGEATSTASSGAYEQPLGFNQPQPTTTCPQTGQPLVGSEMGMGAPRVAVVDITTGNPTTQQSNQPQFDDMPYLSSHPSSWSFDGDEDEFLSSHGWERPTGDESDMSVAFDELDDDDDQDVMSAAFDVLDDDEDEDVFNSLQMFTETKNGLGWK